MAYIFLILAFCFNAAANILLKIAAGRGFSFSAFLKGEINDAHLIALGAAVLFAANLAFYIIALQKLPITLAYPVMIGMTFLITVSAGIALGEYMTWLRLAGCLLIVGGVIVAAQG